jgi:hypothetical protein
LSLLVTILPFGDDAFLIPIEATILLEQKRGIGIVSKNTAKIVALAGFFG